jgi:hypothetical protein
MRIATRRTAYQSSFGICLDDVSTGPHFMPDKSEDHFLGRRLRV